MQNSTIGVTAYDWVPSFAQGLVRDLRVRWALEEAGLAYRPIILEQGSQRGADNIARQPFGQVPAMEIDGQAMFESGAIVWRIAEASDTLLPADPAERDRVHSWYFAAMSSVEPEVMMLAMLDFFASDKDAAGKVRPDVVAGVEGRLTSLSNALGPEDWLVGGVFSAADLMMATVLRILGHTDILCGFPTLHAYLARCIDRPAFAAALEAQMRTFAENAAKYERES